MPAPRSRRQKQSWKRLGEQKSGKSRMLSKQDVEVWINTIPVRMQRIIRYRIFEGMTWEQVAIRMGRGATGDSVRVEYVRFMNVG